MKKIINSIQTVVPEMCNGMVLAHPDLEFDAKYKVIKKKTLNHKKVSLISGGGSGHEPAHAGFVGKGMLDAAVCGDIFASPSQVQVFQAIKGTAGEKGTLLIIKNYSGDVMNFKNAVHLASEEGINVDYVVVNDDIAVQDSLYTIGRRGVAGTLLVHKIAGAAAEMGRNLSQVKAAAEDAIANTRSFGFALSSCTVPAKGTQTFEIGENQMEYGVGIHGEPGISREQIVSADALASRIIGSLVEELKITDGDEVTLLVNGFGGSPLQELYLLNNAAFRELSKRGVSIYRVFVGNFMTSIDMLGASISIMKMHPTLKMLLSAECDTAVWKITGETPVIPYVDIEPALKDHKEISYGMRTNSSHASVRNDSIGLENLMYIVDRMGTFIIENEIAFCELDAHAGDGDFGMSVAKGFRQLKCEWESIVQNHKADIGAFLKACALVIMEYCGGASGPIWGSAFYAAGRATGGKTQLSVTEFAQMLQAAVDGIQATGKRSFGRGAVVGDKTLIDAMVPCAESWKISALQGQDFQTAFLNGAKTAVDGAKQTENIVASMGRAENAGERSLGFPDAGAYALGAIFTDIANHIK